MNGSLKTFIGFFVAAGVLSLLPESAFCFIRGTCKDRYGSYSYPYTLRQNYANYVRNGPNHRIDEYDDYYYDDEFIEKMGLKMAKKSKREAEAEISDYEVDASYLPAEHRQLGAGPRPRRRSAM